MILAVEVKASHFLSARPLILQVKETEVSRLEQVSNKFVRSRID